MPREPKTPREPKLRRLTDDEKRIVDENHKLVCAIASRNFKNSRLPVKDRVQAGTLGLMRAAQLFDPSRGFAFSTYATRWIKNFIKQAEREHNPIHVPLWITHKHSDPEVQSRAERFHHFRDQAMKTSGGVADDDVAGFGSSETPVDDADELEWIVGKLDRLTEKQQDVLRSIYWDGDEGKAIGRRYDVSRNCVQLWHYRALRRLKEIYDDEYAKGA
jgi:RNA polymerase sigma factor (sigma-70 family)